jgi:hypothetical protein
MGIPKGFAPAPGALEPGLETGGPTKKEEMTNHTNGLYAIDALANPYIGKVALSGITSGLLIGLLVGVCIGTIHEKNDQAHLLDQWDQLAQPATLNTDPHSWPPGHIEMPYLEESSDLEKD